MVPMDRDHGRAVDCGAGNGEGENQKARVGRAFWSGARSAGRVPPPAHEGQAGHSEAKQGEGAGFGDRSRCVIN